MTKLFKIISSLIVIIGMSFPLAACGKVPAGNLGVKVYLLGSEKGVDNEVLGPGRYWVGWNQELFIFPTFTQNKTWELANGTEEKSFNFQTIEGMVVGADLGISYSVQPDQVSTIFQKYRRGIDEITDTYLRNMVRDALVTEGSKVRVEFVYGEGKETLIKSVEDRVRRQVEPIGLSIERIYWIGQLKLPTEVIEKINAKVNADQITAQKVAELEQTRADAKKKIAEAEGLAESVRIKAKAEAEANRVVAESLTEPLVQYRAIEKWDGLLPRFSGSGAVPFIDLSREIGQ